MTKQQPEALRLADKIQQAPAFAITHADEAASLLRNQHAEIERLRDELTALRGQEPVAWMNVRNGFICKKPTNADCQQPLYLAAGAQPAPSTQITPNWIWSWLMDWCKRRGVSPANYDSLFQMASDALAAGAPEAPSVPEGWKLVPAEPTEQMKERGKNAAWSATVAHNETRSIYKEMLAAAPEAPKLASR